MFSRTAGDQPLIDGVEALGGMLALDSPPGGGTTVTITLPLHLPEPVPVAGPLPEPAPAT